MMLLATLMLGAFIINAIFNEDIDDDDHSRIEADLRDMIRQKTEDENVVDKLLGTLKDSVSLVGSLFDSVRTKSA